MSIYNSKIKGAVDVSFFSLDETPGRVVVLPSVSEISKNFNIEVETLQAMTPGSGGVNRTVDVSTMSEDPQYTFTFPALTPELWAIRSGRRLETNASVLRYVTHSNFYVQANEYPARAAGDLGYAIAADANADASYLIDGISVALTQSTFAAFDPAVETLSFAVGENGAMKFSNDLIGKTVGYRIEATYSNVTELGEARYDRFGVNILMIQNDRQLVNVNMPEAFIRLDQGDITFGQPVQITVSPVTGGRCQAEYITYLGEKDACLEPVV